MWHTIKEIEQRLFHGNEMVSDEELKAWEQDERKGVQQMLMKWRKQKEKLSALEEKYRAMSTYERDLRREGIRWIAGVDEAGRGPLAGPVVAGAVILNEDFLLPGLNDSKQLTEMMREKYYGEIMGNAESVGVGIVEVGEIDRLNIYQAAKKAMVEAVEALRVIPEHILADAMDLPLLIPQTSLVKGDSHSVSIAAGSVVAKVTRDRLMRELDGKYPQYGFSRHFGYATAEHLQSLKRHGICDEHRRSFAPVRDLVV